MFICVKVILLARFYEINCHTSCLVIFVQATKRVSFTLRGPDIKVGGFEICTNAHTEKGIFTVPLTTNNIS